MLARRHFSLFAAAAIGALAFVGAARAADPITIGAVEILTGPNNKYGLAIKNGFDLALLPWLVSAATGDASKALQPTELLSGLWPVALGAALALGLRGVGDRLPHVPAGDGAVLFEAGFRRLMAAGPKFEALEASLRQWPLAGVAFLAIVLAMLGASLSGR